MSGDEQQEEPFDGVSTVGGGTEADGVPARQVPSQAGPRAVRR